MSKMQTAAEFLASLGPALDRKGENYTNDVTLAKTIRAELMRAVKAGALPEGTKFSVRINHHASLTVEIVEWHGGAVFSAEYEAHLMDPATKWEPDYMPGRRMSDARYSDDLNAALRTVEAIANRHNYDNSDTLSDHFDVGYYLTVSASAVAAAAERGIKVDTNPAFAALVVQAQAAAKALGPAVTRSICGRGGVGGCGEWAMNKLIKLAERANGRLVVYNKRFGWGVKEAA